MRPGPILMASSAALVPTASLHSSPELVVEEKFLTWTEDICCASWSMKACVRISPPERCAARCCRDGDHDQILSARKLVPLLTNLRHV